MPTRYMNEALSQADQVAKRAASFGPDERRKAIQLLDQDLEDLRVQYEEARVTLVNARRALTEACKHKKPDGSSAVIGAEDGAPWCPFCFQVHPVPAIFKQP